MNCMKCGRETKSDAVFCRECLEHMDRHPVVEHTFVYVPTEKDRAAVKKHTAAHPVVSVEDQLKKLQRRNHVLSLLVIFFMGLSLFFGILSIETIHELNVANLIGQNYTPVVATEAAD